jgi:hypothetical protein
MQEFDAETPTRFAGVFVACRIATMPKPLPSDLYNENEQAIALTPELVQSTLLATPREQLLEAQLRNALHTNKRMLLKLQYWRALARQQPQPLPEQTPRKRNAGTVSQSEQGLARLAREVARLAEPWERGAPPTPKLREFVLKAMRTARPGLVGCDVAAAADTLLHDLAPPARGPRPKEMRLMKIAYLAFSSEPTDAKNRGLRGPVGRLLSETVTSSSVRRR